MRYVYGVVRRGHPPATQHGIGSPAQPVELVESDGLAAAVSAVADGQPITEDDAHAHLRVLTALLESGPVLPIQLGTVVATDDDVRSEVLDANSDMFVAALDALCDCVEVHVDADDEEIEALAEIAALPGVRNQHPSDLSGAIDQGRLVADALMAHREQLADAVLTRLRPLCADDTPRATIRGPEDPVLRWAFLVRRDGVAAFDAAIASVRAEFPGLTFRYVGPLPPAHFTARVTATQPVSDTFGSQGRWGW